MEDGSGSPRSNLSISLNSAVKSASAFCNRSVRDSAFCTTVSSVGTDAFGGGLLDILICDADDVDGAATPVTHRCIGGAGANDDRRDVDGVVVVDDDVDVDGVVVVDVDIDDRRVGGGVGVGVGGGIDDRRDVVLLLG